MEGGILSAVWGRAKKSRLWPSSTATARARAKEPLFLARCGLSRSLLWFVGSSIFWCHIWRQRPSPYLRASFWDSRFQSPFPSSRG